MARGRSDAPWFALPVALAAAFLLFSLLFTGVVFHFWWQMALSVAGLCALARAMDPSGMRTSLLARMEWHRAVLLGAASAGVLYFAFAAGDALVGRVFPAARTQVTSIYALRGRADARLIAALLAMVIGPGEELFWRGFVQRRLADRLGLRGVGLAVAAYGVAHVASGNPMLITAATTCGAFWGLMYWRFGSLRANVLSHVLWDLAVFVFFPFQPAGG